MANNQIHYFLATLRDRIARGVASAKEKAMVEYIDKTRGGITSGSFFEKTFMGLPFSYSRMKDWVNYRTAESEYAKAVARAEEATRRNQFPNLPQSKDHTPLSQIHYEPDPAKPFFSPRQGGSNNYLSVNKQEQQYTTLDIETDDYGRPITISALKQVFNRSTGQFETVDTFQRFYKSRNRDLRQTMATHGLSRRALKKYRRQQHASYGIRYDDVEAEDLKKFLGSSVVVGHNIVEFDLPHLFKGAIGNRTIDTLIAARNMWPGAKNDLDAVYKRLFHKSMEQAGLPHHNSMADTIASAQIVHKMALMEGMAGDAVRYVMTHQGVHIGPWDEYMKSQVFKGYYRDYTNPGAYMNLDDGMSIKDILDLKGEESRFEFSYNDNGEKVLPPGFSYADEYRAGGEDSMLFLSSLSEVLHNIHKEVQNSGRISQEAKEAYALGNIQRKAAIINRLAHFDNVKDMRAELAMLGISNSQDTDIWIRQARDSRTRMNKQKARNEASRAESHIERAQWAAERKGDEYAQERLAQLGKDATPKDIWNAMQDIKEERAKERQYAKFSRHTMWMTEKDRATLDAAASMDELADAMSKISDKSEKITRVFDAMASIPPYNFERLEKTFRNQISGIKGAAQGVIPDFLYSPLSRLTDAAMNSMTEQWAPTKYGIRAFNAIAQPLAQAGLSAPHPAAKIAGALLGVGDAITQIWGNSKESEMIQWGQGIQNNLNTLGFLQDMVLLPFRLLRTAIDKVIKGFGLLAGVIRSVAGIMTGGLSSMTGMGNPLTGMTGTTYGNYMSAMSVDQASLLGAGTLNSIYNDFATQRMQLYTTGQLDKNRLVAASMLGVFDQVYGSRAGEPTALENMVDRIAADVKTQSDMQKKQTYVLLNMVNPNLASIVQSMETLGVDTLQDLYRPKNMVGYSEAAYNAYRPIWQKAQWEYQYAGTQFDTSMKRIGAGLWNMGGRDIYNVINSFMMSLADAFEHGDWSAVKETVGKGLSDLWDAVGRFFGYQDGSSLGAAVLTGIKGTAISVLEFLRDDVLPVFESVWDSIGNMLIDKLTNFAHYLGGFSVDFTELKKMLTGEAHGDWLITPERTYAKGTTNLTTALQDILGEDYVYNVQAKNVWKDGTLSTGFHVTGQDKLGRVRSWEYSGEEFAEILAKETGVPASAISEVISKSASPEELAKNLAFMHGSGINALAYMLGLQDPSIVPHSQLNQGAHEIHDTTGDIRKSGTYALIDNLIGLISAMGQGGTNKTPLLSIAVNTDKGKSELTLQSDGTWGPAVGHNDDVSLEQKDGAYKFILNGATQIVGQ